MKFVVDHYQNSRLIQLDQPSGHTSKLVLQRYQQQRRLPKHYKTRVIKEL